MSHHLKGLKSHEFPAWKGGSKRYWHKKARQLFGKDRCERCKKKPERLDMHNTLVPKDYTVMEENAWLCVCQVCHWEIEYKDKPLPWSKKRKPLRRLRRKRLWKH